MIAHAMKYVGMADRVRAELPGGHVSEGLELVVAEIVFAERQAVWAYGNFRKLMERAAALGSPLAQKYLEETLWDLT